MPRLGWRSGASSRTPCAAHSPADSALLWRARSRHAEEMRVARVGRCRGDAPSAPTAGALTLPWPLPLLCTVAACGSLCDGAAAAAGWEASVASAAGGATGGCGGMRVGDAAGTGAASVAVWGAGGCVGGIGGVGLSSRCVSCPAIASEGWGRSTGGHSAVGASELTAVDAGLAGAGEGRSSTDPSDTLAVVTRSSGWAPSAGSPAAPPSRTRLTMAAASAAAAAAASAGATWLSGTGGGCVKSTLAPAPCTACSHSSRCSAEWAARKVTAPLEPMTEKQAAAEGKPACRDTQLTKAPASWMRCRGGVSPRARSRLALSGFTFAAYSVHTRVCVCPPPRGTSCSNRVP